MAVKKGKDSESAVSWLDEELEATVTLNSGQV